MKGTKVAARYAKALLELAIERKSVDSVLGDMQFLLQVNNEARDFELLIASPIVKADKKMAIFKQIFEQFELKWSCIVSWGLGCLPPTTGTGPS